MNTKDLIRLGVPAGAPLKLGMEFIVNFISQGGDPSRLEDEIAAIIANPAAYLGDPQREAFARALYEPAFKQREKLAPCDSGAPAWSLMQSSRWPTHVRCL